MASWGGGQLASEAKPPNRLQPRPESCGGQCLSYRLGALCGSFCARRTRLLADAVGRGGNDSGLHSCEAGIPLATLQSCFPELPE